MIAKIGALKFNATKGFITGGSNFQTGVGATIGEFTKGLAAHSGILAAQMLAISDDGLAGRVKMLREGMAAKVLAG